MEQIHLILGIIILLAGEKFFWLFVAIIGFILGMDYAEVLFNEASQGLVVLLSLTLGVIGAVLAVFAQWIAILMAGFLGVGYLFLMIMDFFTMANEFSWAVFLTGGIIGSIIMVFVFDWALICISSLLGALLIVDNLNITEGTVSFLFLAVLTIIGFIVQSKLSNPSKNAAKNE